MVWRMNYERTSCLILSLQKFLDHNPTWASQTVSVTAIDPRYHHRPWLHKLFLLTLWLGRFEVFVFHRNDHLLAFFLACWKLVSDATSKLVLEDMFFDVTAQTGTLTGYFRRVYYQLLLQSIDRVGVHTSHESRCYTKMFRLPKERVCFTRWFVHGAEINNLTVADDASSDRKPYLFVAGTLRDYSCVINAVANSSHELLILLRPWDLKSIKKNFNLNVQILCDIDRDQYFDYLRKASIVIVPIGKEKPLRSLGHSQLLEAFVAGRPVVCSRTFHVIDYVDDNDVLFYEPGNSADLLAKINLLVTNPALARSLVEHALEKLKILTLENYLVQLFHMCR
jgi:glycosyltransferase involved in cell wall biosynthesis